MSPRGGKRKGAGRPKLPQARETLAVRVLPATRKQIEWLADEWGQSQGDVIDWLVDNMGERP